MHRNVAGFFKDESQIKVIKTKQYPAILTEQASSIKDLFYTPKTLFLKYRVSKAANES